MDDRLVQCCGSSAGLATEWRLMVAQPFKAGVSGLTDPQVETCGYRRPSLRDLSAR